ncbi:MAG: hypothetical protein ABEJ04_05755 [Halobacteriaceae archaeon]
MDDEVSADEENAAPGSRDEVGAGESGAPERLSRDIDPAVLELDAVFDVLAHPRRRYLLYALATDGEWTLRELATKLAAWEEDVDEAEVTDHVRDRVYVSLYHSHVPKLVDEGMVRFDEDGERLSPAEHAEQVQAALAGAGGSLDDRRERHAEREYVEGDDRE